MTHRRNNATVVTIQRLLRQEGAFLSAEHPAYRGREQEPRPEEHCWWDLCPAAFNITVYAHITCLEPTSTRIKYTSRSGKHI